MHIKNKIIAAIAVAAFVLPGISLAQTQSVASLQAEIQSLLAELQTLEGQAQSQAGSASSATSASAWCYTFNTNLSIGASGAGVTALQTALEKNGESITVNGTFDDETAAAVTAFQEKYASIILTPAGLKNGTGYAGKGTRAELNALFGCGTTSTPTATAPNSTISSIEFTAPVTNEVFPVGSEIVFQWHGIGTANSSVAGIKIVPVNSSASQGFAIDSPAMNDGVPDSNGQFSYFVPSGIPAGEYYALFYGAAYTGTTETLGSAIGQTPDFYIGGVTAVPAGGIYPSGGQTLTNGPGGNITTITWNTDIFGGIPLSIYLRNPVTQGNVKEIVSSVPNTGAYVWASDPTIPSGSYEIYVTAYPAANEFVESASPFTLVTGGNTTTTPQSVAVTITANPSVIGVGQSTTLSWSSTNATSCSGTGSGAGTSWNGENLGTTGSQTVTPINDSGLLPYIALYGITCSGTGGTGTSAVGVSVSAVSPTTPALSITGVSPASGTVGATVTLSGSGFASTGNVVEFNGDQIATVNSANGTTLSFAIPSSFAPACTDGVCSELARLVEPGTYSVSVVTGGQTSNAESFTVTQGSTLTPILIAPTVSLSASPNNVDLGQSLILKWSSSGATSCNLDNGAAGFSATGGSQTLTPSTPGTYTYTMTCSGPGGTSAPASATVTVNGLPSTPTVTVSANPTIITLGQSTVITWSGPSGSTCTDSGAFGGSGLLPSAAITVTPTQTGVSTYMVTCSDAGGSSSASVSVTVNAAPVVTPTPAITSLTPASGTVGTAVTVIGSGFASTGNLVDFAGSQVATVNSTNGTSLSFVVPSVYPPSCTSTACSEAAVLIQPGTYSISVVSNGKTSNSLSFVVNGASLIIAPPPIPTVNFSMPTAAITLGHSFAITWTTANATACAAIGPTGSTWNGSKATSGTQSVTPSAAGMQTEYALQCSGPGGTQQVGNTITVNPVVVVTPPPALPTPPVITSVSPISSQIGNDVSIFGTGFTTSTLNTIMFGKYIVAQMTLPPAGLNFRVPSTLTAPCSGGQTCSTTTTPVIQNEIFLVTVVNANGTSNAKQFTIAPSN